MNYPLISEYIVSIKYAEDNFATLTNLRPVLDDDGNPVMSSGNFAVVFKMQDIKTNEYFAIKCFTREQEGRVEAYKEIAKELSNYDSQYLISFEFIESELFVHSVQSNETEFPIVKMKWVEGITLEKYIRKHLNDRYKLSLLTYRLCNLAIWLVPQSFAHGDIKPDNMIICNDGSVILVDYDGMFVPEMKGQRARELGSPNFQLPSRKTYGFNEHIDDFPLLSIILSVKLISIWPNYLLEFGNDDRLLFSERDYKRISSCEIIKKIFPSDNKELNIIYSIFLLAFSGATLDSNVLGSLAIVGDNLYKRAEAYCHGSWARTSEYWETAFCDDELPIDENKEQAYRLFLDIAKIGNKDAQCCLGCLLWDKLYYGAKRNESVQWYVQAATNGDKRAIRHIFDRGSKLFVNSNCFHDYKEAFELFKMASNYGDEKAKAMMAFCYDNGLGINVDASYAMSIYESITKGDVLYDIGKKYFEGDQTLIDYNKSLLLFSKAVSLGNESAYAYVAISYYLGIGNVINRNESDILINKSSTTGLEDLMCYYYRKESYNVCIYILQNWLARYTLEDYLLPLEERPLSLIEAIDHKEDLENKGYVISIIQDNNIINPKEESISTEVTEKDWANACEDKYGAKYSEDGKRFLGFGGLIEGIYHIRQGTQVICDLAFNCFEHDNHYLDGVYIPDSVRFIGENPFAGCVDFKIICDSPYFNEEDGILYDAQYRRLISISNPTSRTIPIDNRVKIIGPYACSQIHAQSVYLPIGLEVIEDFAFSYSEIEKITIPESVYKIGWQAFVGCKKLWTIYILNEHIKLDEEVFDSCDNIHSIYVSKACLDYFKQKLKQYSDIIKCLDDGVVINREIKQLI